MMLPENDATLLSLLYHLNSEPWSNLDAGASPYEVEYRELDSAGAIPLPACSIDTPLAALLAARQSCRDFTPQPMPLLTLATLLGGALGITRTSTLPGVGPMFLRAAPSAGGLYPLEAYVLAQQVETLEAGVYHYNVRAHALELVRGAPDPGELATFLASQSAFDSTSALVFLTAVFLRTQKKYGPRGYRHALLEAGHIAQTLCLLAAEQSLGSLCVGGFFDGALNRFLCVDGTTEAALYCVGIGYPSSTLY